MSALARRTLVPSALVMWAALLFAACTPSSHTVTSPPRAVGGAPLRFSFGSESGPSLHSEDFKGRASLVLLLTTFDTASQLMALRANELLHTFKPRINVGAVVMEAPKYEQLTETYKETLGLDYPVVLADARTMSGHGAFGEVERIPTLLVLDSSGREFYRFSGPASPAQVESALRDASKRQ